SVRDREVEGSNPFAPTFNQKVKASVRKPFSLCPSHTQQNLLNTQPGQAGTERVNLEKLDDSENALKPNLEAVFSDS
ncbi:MAG: hypothetical protein ABI977_10700, partial [Acidobacteriota bacterium]